MNRDCSVTPSSTPRRSIPASPPRRSARSWARWSISRSSSRRSGRLA